MTQTTIYDFIPTDEINAELNAEVDSPNFVTQIYQFNLQAGLLDSGYDDFLESSFQIEEALEGFEDDNGDIYIDNFRGSPKEVARDILFTNKRESTIPDVDRLDKACDAIVFALGSIFKLGLSPAQATRALNMVMMHNFRKLSMPKDSFGKLTKPANFEGPEASLQALLNERAIHE